MLFLFNAAGKAVIGDDDVVNGAVQESTLSKGTIYQPPTAGVYYLAISLFNNSPTSASGAMFTGENLPGLDGNLVMGPADTGSLSGWNGETYSGYGAATYSIALEGTSAVPLPPSVLLLGSGILGLVGLGWKRRKEG